MDVCREHGVKDIVITTWGDDGGECSPYAVLPSIVYAAQCAKGNFGEENAKKRFAELFGEEYSVEVIKDVSGKDRIIKGVLL